ncbi:unnamed protein product [Cuscuta campestris]|uniref:Uncharacterized protein n=1 Tax=Cuscuta campestris TaxID=132261 RepID=A0A484KWH4_9ASTE|nr:unnamed protein product [Cuscuta campestris]
MKKNASSCSADEAVEDSGQVLMLDERDTINAKDNCHPLGAGNPNQEEALVWCDHTLLRNIPQERSNILGS